jgi:pyruvate ferredoxin oxidoreductase beta subunit
MPSIKQLSTRKELLSGGHRACAGCAGATVIRQVLLAAGENTVTSCSTGCMEVVTTIYPYTAWRVPFIHNAFENSAATMSGVQTAYEFQKKMGLIDKDIKFIAFGGDGGTYDIGFQSLSGAMERGHNMLYVCYDNEAYMNTGIQRSSSTPRGAATSTSPAGSVIPGKQEFRKDLTACIIAHDIPFVAQASPSNWNDLVTKVEKALSMEGPAFMNIIAPCHRGWRYEMPETMEIARMAVDTCFWPLFEVENGNWKMNYKPREKAPLNDWLSKQGRFRHLFRPENEHMLAELQSAVDERWEDLLWRCGREKTE